MLLPDVLLRRAIALSSLLVVACSQPTTSPAFLPPTTPPLMPLELPRALRVVTFGDSNTGGGWVGSEIVEASYVTPTQDPTAPTGPHTLAGKLEALTLLGDVHITAVNHGITAT